MSSRKLTIFLLALVLLAGGSSARAFTSVNVGVSFGFHDVLAPYGTWVQVGSYGECWRPRVSAAFVPFTSGHWVYTSYGPTWVGTEPWAWCAYHYGHWAFSPEFGWVWVPGYSWSPAPVEWAYGADYLAWSPYVGAGPNFNFWVGLDYAHFGYNNYAGYVLPRTTMRALFDRRAIRIHSGMLQRDELERIVRRPVQVERVDEREVVADRHATRLILPRSQSATAMREISRVQHERPMSARVTGRQVENRSEKHVTFTRPSGHFSTASRTPERFVTRNSSASTHGMSRNPHGSRDSEFSRSFNSHYATSRSRTSHHATGGNNFARYVAPRHSGESRFTHTPSRVERSYRPETSPHSSYAMKGKAERMHQSSKSVKSSRSHKKPPQ